MYIFLRFRRFFVSFSLMPFIYLLTALTRVWLVLSFLLILFGMFCLYSFSWFSFFSISDVILRIASDRLLSNFHFQIDILFQATELHRTTVTKQSNSLICCLFPIFFVYEKSLPVSLSTEQIVNISMANYFCWLMWKLARIQ